MKQLEFTLSLIDKLTRPLKQAQASVSGFAEKSRTAFSPIGLGAAGLVGAGLSIKGALGPAIAFDEALKSASARGMDDNTLARVGKDALAFSAHYGRSATEFIHATEAIRAQVAGLSQDELPRFTVAANTLAMAVKSSAGDAADYMASLYQQFDSVAKKMGRVPFAEQLASKTAYLAQAFGTDMQTIADLMEGARGVGANYGVGMDEQLAALGMLEKILGTEASSSYEAFYKVAEDGAKQLGLSVVNSAGQMLSLPEMLTQLQGRYGASIEGNLKAQAELDKAFGDGANVIKQLYGNTEVLNRHIHALGSNDGLKRARDMAEKMIVPWDRLTAIWTAIRIAMGRTLLPVLYPFINKLADGGQKLARWLTLFPNIARVVGTAVLALLSLAGAGALVNIAMGVSAFVMVGLKGVWSALIAIVKLHVAALWLYHKAVLAWAAVMRMMRGVLLAVRIAAVLTGIAMNVMSWPILLIVGAVALLVVGCLALVKYWDTLKATMMQTTAFQLIAAYVSWLARLFTRAWEGISAGWQALCAYFAGFSLSDTFAGMIDGVSALFTGLWASVKATFARTWNTLAETLNHLPGVNLSLAALPGDNPAGVTPSGPAPARPASGPPLLTGGQTKGLSPGGLSREITSHQRSVTDNSRHINQVHIHTTQGMTPEGLLEWQEMHA